MIKIYPSLLPGEPIETQDVSGMTFGAWLKLVEIDYRAQETQPIVVSKNGEEIPVDAWEDLLIKPGDLVEVRIRPHGGIFGAIGSLIGGIFNFAFGWLMPKAAKTNSNSTPDGQKLESSEAKANVPKLGGVVPEQAGRFRRFPDYLTPPRRRFDTPREQRLEFFCCIGPGLYEIEEDNVKIGNTPFNSMGDKAVYTIYPPGVDVSGDSAHEHWFSVPEVGGTSAGTAGLELSAEPSSEVNPTASLYSFLNSQISTPEDESFPSSWGPGTSFGLTVFQSYDVTTIIEVDGPVNRFTGNFREVAPTVGSPIRARANSPILSAGNYLVRAASLDAAGNGWIELTHPETLQPVGDVPNGAQRISFFVEGRSYVVTAQASERSITIAALDSGGGVVAGWPGWNPMNVYPADAPFSVNPSTVNGEWTSLFVACPSAEVTTKLEVDFFFPQGLCRINNDGNLEAIAVGVEMRYRDARVGGTFTNISKTYADATLDQIGFTEVIEFPAPIRPEIQVRRLGAKATSTQVNDEVQWYGLRSQLPTTTSYPGWTTMSIRIPGAGEIGAASENQVNLVSTRILPELLPDGSWSEPRPTRQIAAFAKYVLDTIGYAEDRIDMEEWIRLQGIWTARGDTVDNIFDEGTVKSVLDVVFGAGMGEFTIANGQIRPVRESVRTVFEQTYSPLEMLDFMERKFRTRRSGDFDGVEVEYIDEESWTSTTIRCMLPGDQGFKIEKLKVRGATNRTKAWRIGMRRRRDLKYTNWEYSFETEMSGFNSEYLGYVSLFDDIEGYGKAAYLEDIRAAGASVRLTVSEPMEFQPGAAHLVAYRAPDGKLVGPFPAQMGDDNYQIIAQIPQPWPEVSLKMELPHVFLGTTEQWTFPALISSVQAQGMERASVSAVNYDERVYADDDNVPPQD